MNGDERSREIDDIERALLRADPMLGERLRALGRASTLNVLLVVFLLATGAVLFTTGLATHSLGVWSTGLAALLSSVLVDQRHQRKLRKAPTTYEEPTSVHAARATHGKS